MSQETIEDLSHRFHNDYRNSGIAICVSLTALAISEIYWFYDFIGTVPTVLTAATGFQIFLYSLNLFMALVIIILSFFIQSQHYYGLRLTANVYANLSTQVERLKAMMAPMPSHHEPKLTKEDIKLYKGAQKFLSRADTSMTCLLVCASINLIALIFYIACYRP